MIRETIITTLNPDGSVHIAPMGVHREGEDYVIAPFKPSATLDNLRRTGCAVINLTDDVRIFAGCLTGRRDWPTVPATVIAGQRLAQALSHIEVEVGRFDDDAERPRFYCQVKHRAMHAPFTGFNRAQAAVLEAAILVSRLHRLPAEKIDRELDYLRIAVNKTAGPNERQAWDWLMARIRDYRAGQAAGEGAA